MKDQLGISVLKFIFLSTYDMLYHLLKNHF
jgi:hypothetical protein